MPKLFAVLPLLALLLTGCGETPEPLSVRQRAPSGDPLFDTLGRIVEARYRRDADDAFVRKVMAATVIQPADLNGDGREERIVEVNFGMDSTGNRGFYVLSPDAGGWRIIGEMGGDTFRVLGIPKNLGASYPDLETVWNFPKGGSKRRVYRHNGVGYIELR
ncbi:MAG: hypothetical protein KIS92_10790 [Planctomycetota bacterium]|nr:hypothetical protein [Planctomycetota bacterium]